MNYAAVVQAQQDSLHVTALVGSTTVVLGFDLAAAAVAPPLLGFAVRRTDRARGTTSWLKNPLKFANQPYVGYQVAGTDSRQAPIQQFHWIDETVDPDNDYRYTVTAMGGTPDHLQEHASCDLDLHTAAATNRTLSLCFNRGITATPAYRTQFNTLPLDTQPPELRTAAEAYLSRGLREELLTFIAAAAPDDALDIAIYEFQDAAVVAALVAALDRGVSIRLIAHAKPDATGTANAPFLADLHPDTHAALHIVARRHVPGLSHNKVVVHRTHGTPVRVWCGSTNMSVRGFCYQTNVGITSTDAAVAHAYGAYLDLLAADPPVRPFRAAVADLNATATGTAPCQVFFSPSTQHDLLDTLVTAIGAAQDVVMISCPFGLDQRLADALAALNPQVLVYALLNTNQRGDLAVINRDARQQSLFVLPTWIEQLNHTAYDASVGRGNQIHVKSLVVDPWGANPIVVLGSANFSDESVTANDENTLVLRGNQWAAAITATEFLRVFSHYRFRHHLKALAEAYDTTPLQEPGAWTLGTDDPVPVWLIPPEAVHNDDPAATVLGVTITNLWLDATSAWCTPYRTPHHPKWRERQVFTPARPRS